MKLGELQKLAESMAGASESDLRLTVNQQLVAMGLDPHNFYQELEMTSHLVDTHRDVSYSNANMQLHSHAFYEVLYCCNSCGAQYLVGSERYRLEQGDIIFVPPGVSHRPLLPENMSEPYERYVLWLSQEFMERFAALFPYPFTENQARSNILRTAGTPWEAIGQLFRRGIREAEQQSDGWEAAVVGNTITLLTQIKRATDERSTRHSAAEKPELLDRIANFVENNYMHQIGVSDLSKQFYVSASTVSHLFKQRLGVSFYRYVTQRRLIAAKALIERGQLLEEVARSIGFSDYSVFYRAFKQEYGISPRQYRNRQAGDVK